MTAGYSKFVAFFAAFALTAAAAGISAAVIFTVGKIRQRNGVGRRCAGRRAGRRTARRRRAWRRRVGAYRLVNGKYECQTARFAAAAGYASCLGSGRGIPVADGGHGIDAVAGEGEHGGVPAGNLTSGNDFAAGISHFYSKVFRSAGADFE